MITGESPLFGEGRLAKVVHDRDSDKKPGHHIFSVVVPDGEARLRESDWAQRQAIHRFEGVHGFTLHRPGIFLLRHIARIS